MAQQKLPIKDILAAIDMGAKNVWDELNEEERKQVSFWLLNRYISAVQGSTDDQALAVFKTNDCTKLRSKNSPSSNHRCTLLKLFRGCAQCFFKMAVEMTLVMKTTADSGI